VKAYRAVLVFLGGSLFSITAKSAILGTDDRKEVYEVRDAKLRSRALSAAVLLHRNRKFLIPTSDGYELSSRVRSHAQAENLCSDQRFRDQPTPGYCSAFLVGTQAIATVAHCVDPDLDNMQVVFGFARMGPGKTGKKFYRDDLYSVASVSAQNAAADWAILTLDRPVVGRPILHFRTQGSPEIGEPLAAIGFPNGLPLKVSDNAQVLEYSPGDHYIEADVDVFEGSSGSAVINTKTYEVEGMVSVAFGLYEWKPGNENGKPCHRLRQMKNPETWAPAWVVSALLIPSVS
jgi:hypothetical protein